MSCVASLSLISSNYNMLTTISSVLTYFPWDKVADLLTHLQATIMRPAVMIGTEDRILNPWAFFAKKYGFLPLIGGGSTKYVSGQFIMSFWSKLNGAFTIHVLTSAFAEFNLYSLLMLLLQLFLLWKTMAPAWEKFMNLVVQIFTLCMIWSALLSSFLTASPVL